MRGRSATVVGVIGAAVASCATPAPLVRLSPSQQDVLWVAGRASVIRENGGVRVAAAFEHQAGELLGLRVEVENATDGRIDLEPRQFTYSVCSGADRDTCVGARRIVDPERILASLDEMRAREQANAANSEMTLGVLVILTAAADIAALADGQRSDGRYTLHAVNQLRDENDHRVFVGWLDSQQQLWSNQALRRTTLLPGHGAAGRVFIPVELGAHTIWLHVRTAGRTFSFPFRQTVTPVAPVPEETIRGGAALTGL